MIKKKVEAIKNLTQKSVFLNFAPTRLIQAGPSFFLTQAGHQINFYS